METVETVRKFASRVRMTRRIRFWRRSIYSCVKTASNPAAFFFRVKTYLSYKSSEVFPPKVAVTGFNVLAIKSHALPKMYGVALANYLRAVAEKSLRTVV